MFWILLEVLSVVAFLYFAVAVVRTKRRPPEAGLRYVGLLCWSVGCVVLAYANLIGHKSTHNWEHLAVIICLLTGCVLQIGAIVAHNRHEETPLPPERPSG